MKKGKYFHRLDCRLCGSSKLVRFLNLGLTPLAGDYLTEKQIGKESYYPLVVYFCEDCTLVQLLDVIPPRKMFKSYLSSVSLSFHFEEYAREMFEKFIGKDSFVVEIGSNDGVLLLPLKKMGVEVLGVDPAEEIAMIAGKKGVETMVDYFGEKVAKKIFSKYGPADAIFANNVLAHIDDMEDVARGIRVLLKKNGVLVFEVHYLVELIEKLQYDFFYHEHLCYYSLTSLVLFLRRFGFEIFDAKRIGVHAGSIRVYAKRIGEKKYSVCPRVSKFLRLEEKMGIKEKGYLLSFSSRVKRQRKSLRNLLYELKKRGEKVVGYGASGRGNTLLNYCDIGTDLVEYIVDESPLRAGRFTPGTHIPIVKPDIFRNDNSSYSLLIAWNYKDIILEKEKAFVEKGGKFIVPLPKVEILHS